MSMSIRRFQLFEFHDLGWFPATFRDALTEWLRVLWVRIDAYKAIAPVLAEVLKESGASQVVDLCSGGGGPLVEIQQALEASGHSFHAIVTDKFPNAEKMAELESRTNGRIGAVLTSVDATAVPRNLSGLRTLFNSFHHFDPPQARQILKDAFESLQPIAVMEIPNREFVGVAFSFFATFRGVLLLTPTMRPRKLLWWVFTYALPVIPFIVAWDGWVSHLRAYTPEELLQMTPTGSAGYRWEIRKMELKNGQFTITCLLGIPQPRLGSTSAVF